MWMHNPPGVQYNGDKFGVPSYDLPKFSDLLWKNMQSTRMADSQLHSHHLPEPLPSTMKGLGTDLRLLRSRQDGKHTALLNCSVIFTGLGACSSITSDSNTASDDSVRKKIIQLKQCFFNPTWHGHFPAGKSVSFLVPMRQQIQVSEMMSFMCGGGQWWHLHCSCAHNL